MCPDVVILKIKPGSMWAFHATKQNALLWASLETIVLVNFSLFWEPMGNMDWPVVKLNSRVERNSNHKTLCHRASRSVYSIWRRNIFPPSSPQNVYFFFSLFSYKIFLFGLMEIVVRIYSFWYLRFTNIRKINKNCWIFLYI
jgi:hypothetical protein